MKNVRCALAIAMTFSSFPLCCAQTPETRQRNDRLTSAEFHYVAAACAPSVPFVTLRAIARVESGFHPYALSLDYPKRTAREQGLADGGIFLARQPKNLTEALAWTHWLLRHGRSVSIGLMQISTQHAADLGLSVDQLFDSCTNVRAGAEILAVEYQRAAALDGEGQTALRRALSGVVSYAIKGQAGGSTISGSDPADRFIMGLLRASADAIMVGARTVHDVSPKSLWIPEYTYPDAKHLYAEYRVNVLHKPKYPLLVIVSGSGRLELERAIFRTPGVRTVVITTSAGRDELARRGATTLGSVEIHALNSNSGSIAPLSILRLLNLQFGIRMLLHEGGATLFGQFLAAEAVDELFMTLSPQIAGRNVDPIRPALVQGVAFVPDSAPWFQLLSVKQRAEHLYLRYRRIGVRSRCRKPKL